MINYNMVTRAFNKIGVIDSPYAKGEKILVGIAVFILAMCMLYILLMPILKGEKGRYSVSSGVFGVIVVVIAFIGSAGSFQDAIMDHKHNIKAAYNDYIKTSNLAKKSNLRAYILEQVDELKVKETKDENIKYIIDSVTE